MFPAEINVLLKETVYKYCSLRCIGAHTCTLKQLILCLLLSGNHYFIKKKVFWRTFFAVSLSTIPTLWTRATERGQTDRQWKLWHKQSKKGPIPPLPDQLHPQPARLCHDPGDASIQIHMPSVFPPASIIPAEEQSAAALQWGTD